MPLSTNHPWRQGFALVALTALGLTIAVATTSFAQAKKAEKKADKAAPVPKEPKVVDILVGSWGGQDEVAYINQMLEKSWQENKIVHAERCSDYEFIRRASLDIIGRIAKIDEIDRFLKDPPEKRRSILIERLLGSRDFLKDKKGKKDHEEYDGGGEYAKNWANIWTALLMTRSTTPRIPNQQQMREWLSDSLMEKYDGKTLKEAPDWSRTVTELITAQGATNDNGAVNFILAHLGDEFKPSNNQKPDPAVSGRYDMVPVTSRTTRLFLGLRTQCVQCHDHPFNGEWGQHHFWGINAFYRQVDPEKGRPTMMAQNKKGMKPPQFTLVDNSRFNVKGLVPYERRSGVLLYTDATFLDGTKMPSLKGSSQASRRQELAKFVTSSPYFAKAYVNRTWGHFFGRSFTKDSVDDFGEHNPVAHPELLDKLSEDWAKKYSHNPKTLIRWICNSKAYGLSSAANSTNDKPEDEAFFARMLLKPMSPEQLFESLMTATEAKAGQNFKLRDELQEAWMKKLIVNFGDDEGNEGSFNGTVVQALLLMNGKDINDAIMDKETGTVWHALNKFPPDTREQAGKVINLLFKAALNRPPTAKEINKILDPKIYSYRPGAPIPQNQVVFWTNYCQDVFWALLNSNEFILNH